MRPEQKDELVDAKNYDFVQLQDHGKATKAIRLEQEQCQFWNWQGVD